jgi:hypothetical protein
MSTNPHLRVKEFWEEVKVESLKILKPEEPK